MPFITLTQYEVDREGIRSGVNEWIRNNDYADGYVDFDKAVADQDDPLSLAQVYDSGDHLHPSDEGSKRLCETIPDYIYKK